MLMILNMKRVVVVMIVMLILRQSPNVYLTLSLPNSPLSLSRPTWTSSPSSSTKGQSTLSNSAPFLPGVHHRKTCVWYNDDFIMIIWWFYVWWTYICIYEWWLHYDDSWWLTGNLTETTWSRSCSSTEWILSHHWHSISEKYSARITNGAGQPVFPSEWQSLVQIKPLEVEACQWDWNLPQSLQCWTKWSLCSHVWWSKGRSAGNVQSGHVEVEKKLLILTHLHFVCHNCNLYCHHSDLCHHIHFYHLHNHQDGSCCSQQQWWRQVHCDHNLYT